MVILDPEQGTFNVRKGQLSHNFLWVVGMDIEEADRIENVIGKQNKNKIEKYPLLFNLF